MGGRATQLEYQTYEVKPKGANERLAVERNPIWEHTVQPGPGGYRVRRQQRATDASPICAAAASVRKADSSPFSVAAASVRKAEVAPLSANSASVCTAPSRRRST